MTKEQVKMFYDDGKRISHRLMKYEINEKYDHIDGDIRCAGTYINDPHGSSKDANVIFESSNLNTMNGENLEYLIPIKTLRNISSGEELLVNYGDSFFKSINLSSTEQQTKVGFIINNI